MQLRETSLYGIRVYTTGSVLVTQVDRVPLVSSAIINVDADIDEPWPLEVIGHDGKAYHVTMEPGDLVLYESHTVLHGRPFPLKGRFVANVFVHFEPIGPLGEGDTEEDRQRRVEEAEAKTGRDRLPPYVVPNTWAETSWLQNELGISSWNDGDGQDGEAGDGTHHLANVEGTTGSTIAHHAAQTGELDQLREALDADQSLLNALDRNGWAPLHEAVRGGHYDVVKFLIDKGAAVNGMTDFDETPLQIAYSSHGDEHPISKLLEKHGGMVGEEFRAC